MELCSILCGSQDGREVWGRMGTGIFMAKPLCSLPEITKLPEYYYFDPLSLFLSFLLSFFFLQIKSLFFNGLSLLAVQGMFPVRGSWGNSVLGLLPGVVSQVLEQGPRAMAQ